MAETAGELSPHYYRENFLRLCTTARERYADLFEAEERKFLQRFDELDFAAQCLFIRLVSRTGPWFRESKLSYTEIGPSGPLLSALAEAQLLQVAEGLTVVELGKLFTVRELRQAYEDYLPVSWRGGKAALLLAIEELALDEVSLLNAAAAVDSSRVVTPLGVEHVQLLQLLFFGNRHQSLTEFVLSDLGLARYYPYSLDQHTRLFPHRQALDEYLECAAVSDAWYEASESGEPAALLSLAHDMLSRDIAYTSSENRWHRLCNSVARELERQGETTTAFELYHRSRRHPSRERRARLLERAGDWTGALELCREIQDAPWCEAEQEAAARILPRVQRQLDGSRLRRPRDSFPRVDLVLERGDQRVELLSAAHLEQHWEVVRYVENKLMNSLFGLAFWEQIFAPVPGAFHNPYQSVPMDMYEPAFLQKRQASITARLAQLQASDCGEILRDAYRQYRGYQCRWVDWRRLDAELVNRASQVIPPAHLLAIWERMLFDPRENRAGFPDLIALGGKPGEYRLIEVKGPGDALQDSQKRWLRFFMAQDIPAEVAWVEWRDN